MASSSKEGPMQPVIFSTQTPYVLPAQKFMIPASWKRYQLSQLVNKALSLTQATPFDFLINGEILRGTLAEWCAERGVGEEETLELEYIESAMPPQRMSMLPHEEWVSSVSCGIPGHFVTASYDGAIQVFDSAQRLLCTEQAHTAPATSVCVVPSSTTSPNITTTYLVASSSQDTTARLTQLTLDPLASTSRALASLHLHSAPISSIATSHGGTHLLTASWDGTIGFWDTTIPESDELQLEVSEPERKKRKKTRTVDGEEDRPKRKAPLAVLLSHTGRVSHALFGGNGRGDGRTAYSCGLDCTVRTWDTEMELCTGTITASERPFLAVLPLHPPSAPNGTAHTALAASTDRSVGLYDLRTAGSVCAAVLAHPALPSCIAGPPLPSPSSSSTPYSAAIASEAADGPNAPPPAPNENQVLTGAYDGMVRVWDLRSTKAALTRFAVEAGSGAGVQGGKGLGRQRKILSLDWGAGGVVCIGGEFGVEVWGMGAGGR